MSVKNGYLAIALMSGLSLAACSNTAAGAKKDAEINKDKAAVATEEAKDKADATAEKAAAESRTPVQPRKLPSKRSTSSRR